MKMRTGFVTNSSSSNFLIACRGPLTKKKLMDLFRVPKDSPFYIKAEELSVRLIGASERVDETYLSRNRNDFIAEFAGRYIKNPQYNHVYFLSIWKDYISIMDCIPNGMITDDLIIFNEDVWRERKE